jgi:hypothetical protein
MLAALCLAMVFALSLSSYLALCFTSLNMSTRSLAVSHCAELAETGVEQALYALNNNDWTNWSLSGSTATAAMTMTSSGLAPTSNNPTPLNYGNGVTGTVQIAVQNYTNFQNNLAPGPSISSQATMTLPAYAGTPLAPTISATSAYSPSLSPYTSAAPVFVNAVAAVTGTVRFRSAGTLDSYNSINPLGGYQTYAAATPGYSAIVLSQDTSTTFATVRLGNAVVHGYAVGYNYVSPATTNWLSYGTNAEIVGPNTTPGNTIDSSRLLTTPVPYQPTPTEHPVATLIGNWVSPLGSCSNDGSTINLSATLGNTGATAPWIYNASAGINLTGTTVLSIQGPVVIICSGNVTIAGTAQIQLTTPQASLQIFLESGNLNLGGNGIVNLNAVPLPKKVAILSTTNLTGTIIFNTTQPYYGVIYFPYRPLTVQSAATIYGAIVAASVTFTNSPTIHYDLALRSPTPAYNKSLSLQSGAAFDNLLSPAQYSSLVTSVQ